MGTATKEVDAHNVEKITGYVAGTKYRGRVEYLTGQEKLEASQPFGDVDIKVTLHRLTVAADDRLTVTRHDTGASFFADVVWVDEDSHEGGTVIVYARKRT